MVIGKYIRLSLADRDLMKKENKSESESISHQRDLIQNFINGSPELRGCEQYEFFDDGYSGTNFDRPGFERLLEKIKKGEIDCVIVKDFSRFGRDYIELGDYLERIFPFLGVRFISVNDHYDSKDYQGTTGGLDVVMKNIVYDFYSKDLSVKVKTAKEQKYKQGLYQGGHVPFGLKKMPDQKGKLFIDEDAAAIVRKIFALALEGKGTAEIARILNEEHVLTPGQYYCERNPGHKKFKNQSAMLGWNATMVVKSLRQRMYYGALVGHKREYVMPCSKVSRAVPEEQQIILENHHEAIVSKEDWVKAQEVIRKMKKPTRTCDRMGYILKGHARCGHCGRALQYYDKQKVKYFQCNASKNNPHVSCSKGKLFSVPIEDAVFGAIQMMISNADRVDDMIQNQKYRKGEETLQLIDQMADWKKKLEQCKSRIFENMDQLNDGSITREVFLENKTRLNAEAEQIRQMMEGIEKRQKEMSMAADPETEKLREDIRKYEGEEKLTAEMVKAFVEDVLIFDNQHIEIKWNYSDDLIRMLLE